MLAVLIDPVIYLLFKEVSRTELKNTTFSLIKERKNGKKQRILLIFLQYFLCGKKTSHFHCCRYEKKKEKRKKRKKFKKKEKNG